MSRPTTQAMTAPADRARPALAICAAAIGAAVIWSLAGGSWPVVLYLLIVDGGAAAMWLLSAVGIGSVILRSARIDCSSRAIRLATAAAIGLGAMSLLTLGLGLAGWLNRPVAILLIAVGLIALAGQLFRGFWRTAERAPVEWLWMLAVPFAGMAIVAAFVPPGVLWGDEPHGYDVLEYHLQLPREWYEMGGIVPLGHNVFSYFPLNVEMHYLLAMHLKGGPWAGMYLAQVMHVVFVALTVLAVYGIAKPHAQVHSALAAATVPWMTMLAPVAYNEGGLLLFGTLAVAWAIHSQQQMRRMILAGAMAGLACGVKLTALPMVLFAVPVALLLSRAPGVRAALRACVAFVVAGVITFSPWLIRNAIWTGNPVFPEAMSLLGRGHFSQAQAQRWRQAHSPTDQQRDLAPKLGVALSQVLADWRYGFAILPLGVIAAALARTRTAAMLLVLLLIQAAVWIGFTHLQGRFMVLAIPIVAILIGQVNWPAWRAVVLAAAVASGAVGVVVLGHRITGVWRAIGAADLQSTLPDVVTKAAQQGRTLVLAGDAKAFLYQIPMSRLRYRTVFDVDAAPSEGIIEAWTAGDVPAAAVIVVDPNELRRLQQTYAGLPPVEIDVTETFVIDRTAPR